MNIGIRCHDVGKGTIAEIIERLHSFGFEYTQFVFRKALTERNEFSVENATVIGEELKKAGIHVAMLGAYFNPVHSNKELVRKNIDYFKLHLQYASLMHCDYVGTETGSYNDDKWTYNPKNQTEEGYQESMKVFHELMETAEKYHTTLLMEPAYGHVIWNVKTLKRAFDEIHSPYFKVTIDLFNLLYIGNCMNYKEIFHEAMITMNKEIRIIHLKDFRVEEGRIIQCGLGKGIIDFSYIISEIKTYAPQATLIFEGVTGEDIAPSLALISELNK